MCYNKFSRFKSAHSLSIFSSFKAKKVFDCFVTKTIQVVSTDITSLEMPINLP